MLETLLEEKVRGGRWHTLIDKVYGSLNLFKLGNHKPGGGRKGRRQRYARHRQAIDQQLEHLRQRIQRGRLYGKEHIGVWAGKVRREWTGKRVWISPNTSGRNSSGCRRRGARCCSPRIAKTRDPVAPARR